jgi:hypothetical protein
MTPERPSDVDPAADPGGGRGDGPAPGFGPGGYLPDRAARRARKIVLRAPLGLQWVVAALVAGVVLLIAGLLALDRAGSPPGPPWQSLGTVEELPESAFDPATGVLVVNIGGRVRAFEAPSGVMYCGPSNRLEHPDGRVWALTGRGHAGIASLRPVATLTVSGVAYLDRAAVGSPLEPSEIAAVPAC